MKAIVVSDASPIIALSRIQMLDLLPRLFGAVMIPEAVRAGFNAIWACESPPGRVDYAELRRELGPSLGLIGGIDKRVLAMGRDAIDRHLERVIPPMRERKVSKKPRSM